VACYSATILCAIGTVAMLPSADAGNHHQSQSPEDAPALQRVDSADTEEIRPVAPPPDTPSTDALSSDVLSPDVLSPDVLSMVPIAAEGEDHNRYPSGQSPMAQVIMAVYDRLDRPVEINEMSREEALDAVVSGRTAGSFGWQPTSDHMAQFHLSDPIAIVPQIVFSDAFVALEPEQPASLSGRSVCIPAGSTLPDDIRALVEGGSLRTQPANDLETCARLVHDGHSDFFISGTDDGGAVLESLDLQEEFYVASDNPIGVETLHLIIPRSEPDGHTKMAEFNAALHALADEGSVDYLMGASTQRLLWRAGLSASRPLHAEVD
jgi:hypothetical protein